MPRKNIAKITKEVEEDVYNWFINTKTWSPCMNFDDQDFMLQANKYFVRNECYNQADEIDYDWFLKFIRKWSIRDLVANLCSNCDPNEENDYHYPIKICYQSPLCFGCVEKNIEKHQRECGCELKVEKKYGVKSYICSNESSDEEESEEEIGESNNVVQDKGKKRQLEEEDEEESPNKKAKSDTAEFPSTSSQVPKMYTPSGKEKAPCDLCGRFYEKQYGLGIHRYHCEIEIEVVAEMQMRKQLNQKENAVESSEGQVQFDASTSKKIESSDKQMGKENLTPNALKEQEMVECDLCYESFKKIGGIGGHKKHCGKYVFGRRNFWE